MDFNKIADKVEEKSGIKLEEAVCQLVYESVEEEKHRIEMMDCIDNRLYQKLFNDMSNNSIKEIITGYFEDAAAVAQYIFVTVKIDKEKAKMALELLEQKEKEFRNKLIAVAEARQV